MPDEESAMMNFKFFFTHVSPFVPVLDEHSFYRAWGANRQTISPLILEAIFSAVEGLYDPPASGRYWTAICTSRLIKTAVY